MTVARVTIVMSVFNGLELTRACLDSLAGGVEPFELVVVDNGSTDGTAGFLASRRPPYPLHLDRNAENRPVIATLNRAWRRATTEFVCVLHNDTEMLDRFWLSRLLAVLAEPRAGLAGLYGAKRLRKNGRAVGRTIVHSLAEGPTVRPPWEEVVFVDSVCMCARGEAPEGARADLRARAAVFERFIAKYGHRLPADARPQRRRVVDWVRATLHRTGAPA
jgi:glycosyltransferase involved in cell wall biosynthesis